MTARQPVSREYLLFLRGEAWLSDRARRGGLAVRRRYGRAFFRALGLYSARVREKRQKEAAP